MIYSHITTFYIRKSYMSKLSNYSINIEEVCKLDGLVHVYATDLNNIILACNTTQAKMTEEVFGIKDSDIIGTPINKLTSDKLANNNEITKIALEENNIIINSRLPKQFYNVLSANDLYRLELLTIKMPFYTSHGKLAGVLGFSHYINKFSIVEAVKLGLTKRETECLLLLLEGKINKEIANLLKIGVRTVESYIDNIKKKLGCNNKSGIISKAVHVKLTDSVHKGLALLHKQMRALTYAL